MKGGDGTIADVFLFFLDLVSYCALYRACFFLSITYLFFASVKSEHKDGKVFYLDAENCTFFSYITDRKAQLLLAHFCKKIVLFNSSFRPISNYTRRIHLR